MALFRRLERVLPGTDPSGAIGEFWRWWADARVDVAEAIDDSATIALEQIVAPHVAALSADLQWELTRGEGSRHRLVLTASGDPALRVFTERWYRAGPGGDALWEYAPARRPDLDRFQRTARVAGRQLRLADVVVGAEVDDTRCRLDVSVYHPAFPDVPDSDRRAAASRMLEWALGEDDVVRWVGQVRAVAWAPFEEVPITCLGAVVRQLPARWGDRWLALAGTGARGMKVETAARHPMHRLDFPLFDEHIAVRLTFDDHTVDGLPMQACAAELAAFETHLVRRLGRAAVLVGHETSCAQRVLHLYGDSRHSVRPQIFPLAAAWSGGPSRIETQLDPAWSATAHLRPE